MKNSSVKTAVQTSLFVAIALVVRMFSFLVPMGGVGSMRIGFSEVFTKMPAILFGPLYGGMASGLVDYLAQVIKPEGAYLWLMLPVMMRRSTKAAKS
jgi:ECF transporter S component (folate family)